jgi:hypothetical protein
LFPSILEQEDNPSQEHTILRTAGKLKRFNFNKFMSNQYEFVPSRLRPKFQFVENEEPDSPEVLCPICTSPLTATELASRRCAQQWRVWILRRWRNFFCPVVEAVIFIFYRKRRLLFLVMLLLNCCPNLWLREVCKG